MPAKLLGFMTHWSSYGKMLLLPAFFVQDFNAESVDYIPNALASKPWMNFSAFETIILLNLTKRKKLRYGGTVENCFKIL